MPRGNRPSKIDANQGALVDTFEACGWWTVDCHELGRGRPDLFAGPRFAGWFVPVEVKMPGEKLSPAEVKFYEKYPEMKNIISTDADVMELVKRWTR